MQVLNKPSPAQIFNMVLFCFVVFENKDKIVIVMEYASKGELYDYISERRRLTERETRHFFRQIVSAVHYCHKVRTSLISLFSTLSLSQSLSLSKESLMCHQGSCRAARAVIRWNWAVQCESIIFGSCRFGRNLGTDNRCETALHHGSHISAFSRAVDGVIIQPTTFSWIRSFQFLTIGPFLLKSF